MKRLAAFALVMAAATHAAADPLRLRADAYATTASPAGLLVLEAEDSPRAGMSAEAVVWMAGATSLDERAAGDVLVITVGGRTDSGRIAGRVGRFVSTLGALRPVHVDGGSMRVRLPQRFELEAVAGIPVMPGLMTSRSWDWVVGGRASRRLGDWGSVGLAFAERRDEGRLANEELGADAGFTLGKRDDLGARIAYDVANPGLAEVSLTASHRSGGVRTDVYATHRESSHLLPATSLFSVLGDVPSERAGVLMTWKAAPRLDLIGDVAALYVDMLGADVVARARLRLDDRGTSALTGELRHSGVGDDAWTGVRGAARLGLAHALAFSTELELVIPDMDRGKGTVWPWALAALAYDHAGWQAAIAVEASASAQYSHRLDVLAQLGRRWGMR
jgi:hypothetical protein